jgi:hypothetical protein
MTYLCYGLSLSLVFFYGVGVPYQLRREIVSTGDALPPQLFSDVAELARKYAAYSQ